MIVVAEGSVDLYLLKSDVDLDDVELSWNVNRTVKMSASLMLPTAKFICSKV